MTDQDAPAAWAELTRVNHINPDIDGIYLCVTYARAVYRIHVDGLWLYLQIAGGVKRDLDLTAAAKGLRQSSVLFTIAEYRSVKVGEPPQIALPPRRDTLIALDQLRQPILLILHRPLA